MPSSAPRTTKFFRTVRTIADIVALERSRYDELVPARNLSASSRTCEIKITDTPRGARLPLRACGLPSRACRLPLRRDLLPKRAFASNRPLSDRRATPSHYPPA